jgi:histone H3/H4
MRDTSIGSEKERPEINLSAPSVEIQDLPFPRYVNRTIFDKFAKFTPEAKAYLEQKLLAYTEQLIMNSEANAKESGLDNVSAKNVELALTKHHPVTRSRFRRFAGILGGILLGAGLSALISMLMAQQITEIGSILTFALSVPGAFLIALDN